LHLVDPHAPYSPPSDLSRQYCGSGIPEEEPGFAAGLVDELRSSLEETPSEEFSSEQFVTGEQLRWLSDAYDGDIALGDRWLGEVLYLLEELGLTDKTVIAFTSDHGEEIFDHGWVTHGQSVFQELVHVPLVLAGPGVPVGERRTQPVSNRHLAPTLALLAGTRMSRIPDAVDLIGSEPSDPDPCFFETSAGVWGQESNVAIVGVVLGDWSLHLKVNPGGRNALDPGPPEDWSEVEARLFHLSEDPGEQNDVATSYPDRVQAMRSILEERYRELARDRSNSQSRSGAGTAELLEQIGYGGMVESEED
jgi:arylsulfatase A-like enzyme